MGRNRLNPGYPISESMDDSMIEDTRRLNARNFGDATVAVLFSVDDDGRVLDETVNVDRERSTLTRPRYFDLFAAAATRAIQGYRFEIDQPGGLACNRAQQGAVSFRFSYR